MFLNGCEGFEGVGRGAKAKQKNWKICVAFQTIWGKIQLYVDLYIHIPARISSHVAIPRFRILNPPAKTIDADSFKSSPQTCIWRTAVLLSSFFVQILY